MGCRGRAFGWSGMSLAVLIASASGRMAEKAIDVVLLRWRVGHARLAPTINGTYRAVSPRRSSSLKPVTGYEDSGSQGRRAPEREPAPSTCDVRLTVSILRCRRGR